ncbi:major facilitator superfamily domain-containing protein [Aspergillus spectabilis]
MSNKEEPTEHVEHSASVRYLGPAIDGTSLSYRDWRFIGTFSAIAFGFYSGFLATAPAWNQLSSTVALATGGSTSVAWAYPALIFGQTLSSILFGKVSDISGRRWVFISANLLGFVAALACGRVSSGSTIVGLATFLGLASGIQWMGPFVVLAELVPVKHRLAVVASSLAILAPLLAIFPAIAQALATHTDDGWRWCYTIIAIFSFVSMLGLLVCCHPMPPRGHAESSPIPHRRQIKDVLIMAFLAGCNAVMSFVLLWGRTIYAWSEPQMIALLVELLFYSSMAPRCCLTQVRLPWQAEVDQKLKVNLRFGTGLKDCYEGEL